MFEKHTLLLCVPDYNVTIVGSSEYQILINRMGFNHKNVIFVASQSFQELAFVGVPDLERPVRHGRDDHGVVKGPMKLRKKDRKIIARRMTLDKDY
jgi:hypothetical protein